MVRTCHVLTCQSTSKQSKRVQNSLNMSKLVQTCPNTFKHVQTRPNTSEHVQTCHMEGVQYSDIFNQPIPTRARPRGYRLVDYNDPFLEFPHLNDALLTHLTCGDYTKVQGDKVLTNKRQLEVKDFLERHPDWDVDWEDYHAQCSTLPQGLEIWTRDENVMPANWDPVAFGPWCRRRIVLAQLPSMHKNVKYKVVLSYVPSSWDLPEGFRNRFEFTRQPLDRLLGWCCLTCKAGSRTLGCCGHCCALVKLLGVYAFDQTLFKTKHTRQSYYATKQNRFMNCKLLAT